MYHLYNCISDRTTWNHEKKWKCNDYQSSWYLLSDLAGVCDESHPDQVAKLDVLTLALDYKTKPSFCVEFYYLYKGGRKCLPNEDISAVDDLFDQWDPSIVTPMENHKEDNVER